MLSLINTHLIIMDYENQVKNMLESARCQEEFQKYLKCTEHFKSDPENCKELYKEFQFCIVKREEERLDREKVIEKFKQKWGHYPYESN